MILPRILFAALPLISLIGCNATNPHAVLSKGEQSGICPVHNLVMPKVTVPLGYGYYVAPLDGPSSEVRYSRFPFSQWFMMTGGPVVEGESPTTTKVYRCSECEHAKLEWISKHPVSQWAQEEKQSYHRALGLKEKS